MEALIEGLFTRLFQRTIDMRDIAILLLRAMAEKATIAPDNDQRPIAPDTYTIIIHRDSFDRLHEQIPDYLPRFHELLSELASEAGYGLLCSPSVIVMPSEDKIDQAARVIAEHRVTALGETRAVPAVAVDSASQKQQLPLLVLEDERAIELDSVLITIGREEDNDIVVEDGYVSRYHLQLLKRFGRFTLFDVDSRGGTRVNNAATREHILQSGDSIQIGHTCLTFVDRTAQTHGDGTTQVLVPD